MLAGQQIAPTLKLVRPLANGAMGSVWVAEHLALGTQVAVKFMSPALAGDPDLVTRFQHEAMAAARIKSPHIAQVFDHGIAADGSPYIVMELLEGESLGHRVTRLGPLPPGEVARIVAQTAKALAPAHRLGIVHRDIKPDNLFVLDVEGEPFVKVLDFGVAKQSTGMPQPWETSTGIMLGTPRYISPEQSRSARRVDFRADLWSLGAAAYYALTATPPFAGSSVAAVLVAVNEGRFTPPTQVRPELPTQVDAWMARALHLDPEARFGSAAEMAEALALALQAPEAPQAATAPPVDLQLQAGTAPPAPVEPQELGQVGAHVGTFHGVATTATGPGALRTPLLIAAAALGAVTMVVVITWVALSGTPENEATSAAQGGETAEPAPRATSGATTTPAATPPSGTPSSPAPDAVPSSDPATTTHAPARSRTPQAETPRPSRPSSRKKKKREDDIGF